MNILAPLKSILEPEPPSIVTQAEDWGECRIVDFREGKPNGVEYFNPSLYMGKDRDWLIVRRSKYDPTVRVGQNDLVAFALTNFVPQLGYPLRLERHDIQEHNEDPRVWEHNGQIYISACTFVWFNDRNPPAYTGAHQAAWRIGTDFPSSEYKSCQRFDPIYGNNEHTNRCTKGLEKNWIFYSYKNRLFLRYESEPFTVAEFDSKFVAVNSYATDAVKWKYGHIRGGSNPVLHDGLMWEFFHSSRDNQIKNGKRRYYIGALAFDPDTYKVKYLTPEPLLIGSTNDKWFADKPACVFGGSGFIRNDVWNFALGVNDMSSAIAHISHNMLASRLRPVL